MTNELGLNLAGVERVLALEEELERATRRLEALERRSREMREEMEAEVERVRRSFKAELVPYRASTELVRARDAAPGRHRIRVEPVPPVRGDGPPRGAAGGSTPIA
jgi:MerR family transcriptional regulator/heat shock protein HspR